MPGKLKLRATVAALAALGVTALGAPAAGADDAHYEGISADGGVAVFSTDRQARPRRHRQPARRLRARVRGRGRNYVTREVSLGPTGGNDSYTPQFLAIAPAGDAVFFSTKERLTADRQGQRRPTSTSATWWRTRRHWSRRATHVCADPECGNGNFDVSPGAGRSRRRRATRSSSSASSGSRSKTPTKAPTSTCATSRAERTKLISRAAPSCAGSCGAETKPVVFQGASGDGSKAIFTTAEKLTGADTDSETDLYERDLEAGGGEGETKLVSTPGGGAGTVPGRSQLRTGQRASSPPTARTSSSRPTNGSRRPTRTPSRTSTTGPAARRRSPRSARPAETAKPTRAT